MFSVRKESKKGDHKLQEYDIEAQTILLYNSINGVVEM